MCWLCDHPDRTVDDYLAELRATISEHGWAVQFVEDADRPFAYTIGLFDRGLPELLVTGLPPHDSAHLLNWVAAHCVWGLELVPGDQFADPGGRRLEVVRVEVPDAHLKFAVAVGGRNVRALQLVWADARGRWPWETGWSTGRRSQPVLGVRAAAA